MAIFERRKRWVRWGSVILGLIACSSSTALAFDPDVVFTKWKMIISVEGSVAHFGSRLNGESQAVQAWNLSGRFALVPLGVTRFRILSGALDGAMEIGLEPTFERFESARQNFAGLGLHVRYDLVHFRLGQLVPWIDGAVAPGGTDLRIGRVSNQTRLDGPFMNLIQAGIGESYFLNDHAAIYCGLQAQHISNAGFNGANRNFSLNTVEGAVFGVSFYLP